MRFDKLVLNGLGAIIALFVAWQYYESITPEEPARVVKWQINPALSAPLERGTKLEADHLVSITLTIPEDRKSDFSWALDAEDAIKTALVGQPLNQTVQPGAFLERRLFFTDNLRDFALRVLDNNRAFAVDIDGASSLLNFIGPGSRVDIIALIEEDGRTPVAETILEDIEIMAIGPIDEAEEFTVDDAGRHQSVTFQAPPEDIAHYLSRMSAARGAPMVVLRGASNTEVGP